ncbi:hypothetical protein C0585_03610 [Candidatus Woesearchaeota archaeon]|nr:MAG: hypothetical protein C0585_03610 [Candidatus Woesearchaeota archaeon]
MDFEIEKANPNDEEKIIELIEKIYPKGYNKVWLNDKKLFEKSLDEIIVARNDDELIGMIKLNENYWPGVNYIETLIIDTPYRNKGLGTFLDDKAKELSTRPIVSLDRLTSINMLLKSGNHPGALLPNREYIDGKKESLFLTYIPKNYEFNEPIENKVKEKKYNDQTYLYELSGNISSSEIENAIRKINSTCFQIVSVNHIEDSVLKEIARSKGIYHINAGMINTGSTHLNINMFYKDLNVIKDIDRFKSTIKDKEALNMIKYVENQISNY